MSIGPILVELWWDEVEKSSLEKLKWVFCTLNLHCNQKDNGFFLTWFLFFYQSELHQNWTKWHVLYQKMYLHFTRKKMGMFNVVTDSFKGEIFDFKVKRQGLIAGTVYTIRNPLVLQDSLITLRGNGDSVGWMGVSFWCFCKSFIKIQHWSHV